MSDEQEQLSRAWTENACGDATCEKSRLTAALLVLRGEKNGHTDYAKPVLNEYAQTEGK